MTDKPQAGSFPLTATLVAAFVTVAIGFGAWNPSAFATGYRFALFVALAPAVGSLLFALIHRASGGEWGMVLTRYLRPGVILVPWIWLCGFPLLFFSDGLRAAPHGYESLFWIGVRWAIVAVLLFATRYLLLSSGPPQLVARRNNRSWLGPVGLIVMVFLLTFVADDWIESAHPGWHSTAFPLVWMSGQCAGGLALAILLGISEGVRPEEERLFKRDLGNDWGNLLMASLIFWAYVSYGEFIVVWSGNKPDEISWFLAREASGWFYVMPVLFVGNFILPFLLLLSRRFKRNARGLGRLCIALLVGQVLYIAWLILPETQGLTVTILALDALLAAAALGLVGLGYRRELTLQRGAP